MSIRSSLLVPLLLWAGACSPEEPAVMERGVFIDVMIALREAAQDSVEEADFAVRREEILSAAGVTDSMLIEFARVRGRDATYMAAVWDSIDRVVNNVNLDEGLVEDDPVPDTAQAS